MFRKGKMFPLLFMVFAILLSILVFIYLYLVSAKKEYQTYYCDDNYIKSDELAIENYFYPIGTRIKMIFPYTRLFSEPYSYDIGVTFYDRNIDAIIFKKLTRIIPDGNEIDFFKESTETDNSFEINSYTMNPYIHGNEYQDINKYNEFLNNRMYYLDNNFIERWGNSLEETFRLTFIPVNIKFDEVKIFKVNVIIDVIYKSGEINTKEYLFEFKKIDSIHKRVESNKGN